MYAIVRTGGKQYRVAEKTIFLVEKLDAEPGATVSLDEVLLVADGDQVRIGTPTVAGATVTVRVIETSKGRKIRGLTYKPTKNIQRRYGHRQWHTRLQVESIQAP
ncbi:MAG TPA: 50S ribosomal protein L21 [Chthonomonadales bacterium]|nr:50S ribosomal protein L21 [Chthonomonadales bacterium]